MKKDNLSTLLSHSKPEISDLQFSNRVMDKIHILPSSSPPLTIYIPHFIGVILFITLNIVYTPIESLIYLLQEQEFPHLAQYFSPQTNPYFYPLLSLPSILLTGLTLIGKRYFA